MERQEPGSSHSPRSRPRSPTSSSDGLSTEKAEAGIEEQTESSEKPNSREYGAIWALPEMEEDRSEPAVMVTNIANGDYYKGRVFFSLPGINPVMSKVKPCTRFTLWPDESSPVKVEIKYRLVFCSGTLDVEIAKERPSQEIEPPSASKYKLMLHRHASNKDLNLLKAAYECIITPDNNIYKQRTPLGNTVLHLAAAKGDKEMIEVIAVQAPHLLTATNNNYDTALHVAARAGYACTIQILLNCFFGLIWEKTKNQHHQFILETLLMVSLALFRNKQGNTFFHEAFMANGQHGNEIFQAFQHSFMQDFFSNQQHPFTEDTFDEADFKGIVNCLAASAVNREGKSLLYLAVEAGKNKQVVDQLMDICIKYDLVPQGKSPLLPALIERNKDMLTTILSKGKDWIHLKNEEGRLPLHDAASMGFLEGVSHLIEKCEDCIIEMDNNGCFPIHLACIGGHFKIVQELMKCYPHPIEIVDNNGRNLLHVAAESGSFVAVRYILQNPELEVMINQKDNMGNTPLHLATLHWHPKIVHALTWDKRVNLTLLNLENETALDIAVRTHDRNPPLEQRLTWSALKSAGTPRSFVRHFSRGTEDVVKKQEPDMKHYKGRINTLILVSTLIITASFAAGFAMPGSIDGGRAVMLHRVMFHLFILFLTISVFGAIITTIILLWAQLEDLCLIDFSLKCARPVLGISLMALSLAFLAGVHLVVSELQWLAYTFLVISVVLILVVVILYSLLWLPSSSTSWFSRRISYYPFLFLAMIAERKKGDNNKGSTSGSPDFY